MLLYLSGEGHMYLPVIASHCLVQLLHVYQSMEHATCKSPSCKPSSPRWGTVMWGYRSPGPAPNSKAVGQCRHVSWHLAVLLQHLSAKAVPCHREWLISGCSASDIVLLNKKDNFHSAKPMAKTAFSLFPPLK